MPWSDFIGVIDEKAISDLKALTFWVVASTPGGAIAGVINLLWEYRRHRDPTNPNKDAPIDFFYLLAGAALGNFAFMISWLWMIQNGNTLIQSYIVSIVVGSLGSIGYNMIINRISGDRNG